MQSDSRANYRSTMSVSITPWVLHCSNTILNTADEPTALFPPEVMPFGMWHAPAKFVREIFCFFKAPLESMTSQFFALIEGYLIWGLI